MWVKYIGKPDQMYCEHNGKRFVFSRKRPVQDIPAVVYDNIKSTQSILKDDVIPWEAPAKEAPKPEKPKEPEPTATKGQPEEPKVKRGRPAGGKK